MKPGRFLCIVSYWNCHIICETDDECLLEGDGIDREYSPTSMLEFCKYLYEDIKDNIDEWVTFCAYKEVDIDEKRKEIEKQLARLEELIVEKSEYFKTGRAFL